MMDRKIRDGRDVLLQRVPHDEGDASTLGALGAGKRIARRSQVGHLGCNSVSVSSMMSTLLSTMNVEISDLLLDAPRDLALKRQTRSVLSAEGKPCKGDASQVPVCGAGQRAERGDGEVTVAGWKGGWCRRGVVVMRAERGGGEVTVAGWKGGRVSGTYGILRTCRCIQHRQRARRTMITALGHENRNGPALLAAAAAVRTFSPRLTVLNCRGFSAEDTELSQTEGVVRWKSVRLVQEQKFSLGVTLTRRA